MAAIVKMEAGPRVRPFAFEHGLQARGGHAGLPAQSSTR